MAQSPFVTENIKKILNEFSHPQNMAMASAWIAAHHKGFNIRLFDAKETSSLCDYNLIVSSMNPNQSKAIVDDVIFQLKAYGKKVYSIEGMTDSQWILIDLGDIIVHIFQDSARDIFDLDGLWLDTPQIPIPQEYYFGPSLRTADDLKQRNASIPEGRYF